MGELSLNFQIKLQRLSMVKIAAALWENPIIKKEIQDFVKNECFGFVLKSIEEKWSGLNLVKKIFVNMGTIGIPCKLQPELERMIVLLGAKIYLWIETVMNELKDVKFLNRICWTGHGIVDEKQTYQYWKKDSIFDSYISEDPANKLTFYFLACRYADLSVIQANLKDIAKIVEVGLKLKIKETSFKVNMAMTILLCLYFARRQDMEFRDFYANLKSQKYPTGADKMFLHCILQKFEKAAEYFYKKLNDKDKSYIVSDAAVQSLSYEGRNPLIDEVPERTRKTMIYLLRNMSKNDLKKFLVKEILSVHYILFYTWPIIELCVPVLDYIWNDLPELYKSEVLKSTIYFFYFNKCKDLNQSFFFERQVFQNVLSKVSKDSKITVFARNKDLIFKLFQNSHFLIIKMLIEDVDIKTIRPKLIGISKYLGEYLKEGGSSKNIKNYMEQLELSNDEKKDFLKFCEDPDLLECLLLKNLDSAEDVFKWQCNSNEREIIKRRKEMRMDLNFVRKICCQFIKRAEFASVRKLLNWFSDGNEEELKKMIFEIFSAEFLRQNFLLVWMNNRRENLQLADKKCSQLFNFLSEITGETSVVRKIEGIDENFFKTFVESGSYEAVSLDEIFEFLSTPVVRIKEMRQNIEKNIDWWIELCPAKYPNHFLALNILIDWISTGEKKNLIIKRHINTEKGAELCLMVSHFSNYVDKRLTDKGFKEPCRIFFLEWVRPNGNIKKIKKKLNALNGIGEWQNSLPTAFQLLDLCKEDDVTPFLEMLCLT